MVILDCRQGLVRMNAMKNHILGLSALCTWFAVNNKIPLVDGWTVPVNRVDLRKFFVLIVEDFDIFFEGDLKF